MSRHRHRRRKRGGEYGRMIAIVHVACENCTAQLGRVTLVEQGVWRWCPRCEAVYNPNPETLRAFERFVHEQETRKGPANGR